MAAVTGEAIRLTMVGGNRVSEAKISGPVAAF